MQRIPEPELMDTKEQAEAYAAADFSEPHDAFVSLFRQKFPDFEKGDILDLGSGTADVIIRFARAYPEVHITGIDGSDAMLSIGRKDISSAGLEQRIILLNQILPPTDKTVNKFDAVISNSLLHHLESPHVLWDTVRQCSREDSAIFIMDLMRPHDVEAAHLFMKKYASDAPSLLQKDFYNSLLASYTVDEVKQQLMAADLNFLSVEPVSDRHFIIWGAMTNA